MVPMDVELRRRWPGLVAAADEGAADGDGADGAGEIAENAGVRACAAGEVMADGDSADAEGAGD